MQDSVDVKGFGFLDFWIFGFLDFWIFGIFGFLDFWILGFWDFGIFAVVAHCLVTVMDKRAKCAFLCVVAGVSNIYIYLSIYLHISV